LNVTCEKPACEKATQKNKSIMLLKNLLGLITVLFWFMN